MNIFIKSVKVSVHNNNNNIVSLSAIVHLYDHVCLHTVCMYTSMCCQGIVK